MNGADITQAGVVGADTMGAGIAEVFAETGYPIIRYNRSAAGIKRGLERIRSNQTTLIRQGSLTQAEAALAAAEVMSESIAENLEAKQELFHSLTQICSQQTMLPPNQGESGCKKRRGILRL